MELFNVEIEYFYNASYEGKIQRNYTRLVWANSEKEAINFVNKDLGKFKNETLFEIEIEKAISAYKVDSTNKKIKTQYYTPPKL